MNTPSWWQHPSWRAQCLRPLSVLWRYTCALRMRCAKVESLPIPVWCVGNVTAGGGGKTPFCLYLGEQMKRAGINAYFVSRGYGGALAGPLQVDVGTHQSIDVGDEALLLAECLPTIVAHKRNEAARMAVKLGADLIIMDDGLQYPHVHKDKTFLMLKGDVPLGNGYIIPAGPLREPINDALKRSDVVVRMDAQGGNAINTHLPIWHANTHLTIPELPHNKVIAFAGIAYPQRFKSDLEKAGVEVVEFYLFPDHYAYKERDLSALKAHADELGATLITTAKDAVRIPAPYKRNVAVATQALLLVQKNELVEIIKRGQ